MAHLYRRFGLVTVVAVIGLIFVGGFVRASGSGMGCPDWPKCFGLWVPPTSLNELPSNYQEVFGSKLKGEVVFNATKTWIEYINRLLGVLIGIFIIISTFLAYKAYKNQNRKIFYFTFLAFLLVLFEGWLGAKVVATELHPLMVTVHMLVSIIILGLLLYSVLLSYKNEKVLLGIEPDKSLAFLLTLCIALMIGQILFGTQIREGIDIAQNELGELNRSKWILKVEGKVWFHGILALIITFLQFIVFRKTLFIGSSLLKKLSLYGLVFVLCSFLTGAILTFFGFPALIQPFHLTLSTIIISIQFSHLFLIKN
jgi:cytochrome c oxidase assembly protein subunit 15